jgi:DNA replication protein DnaC
MSNCPICDGVGLVRVRSAAGLWVSRACECQERERYERRLAASRIPERYRHCALESYETAFKGANPTLANALFQARSFVEAYPVSTSGNGLLFVGSAGIGKTHLAVGLLQRLVQERGVKGLFSDYRQLIKSIQDTFNPQVNSTEMEILRPLFKAEVLVLDDLGAQKPREWVWDTVALLLNARYNDKLTTIITTNYAFKPAGAGYRPDSDGGKSMRGEDTLGDRIGDRMLSRLAEMCVRVEMDGEDFRQTVKKARFG